MTYFPDFSKYSYFDDACREGMLNIGWLDRLYDFETEIPSEETLEILLEYCRASVVVTRGLHICNICDDRNSNYMKIGGEWLLIGSAEIRVFSPWGDIYAAPNLVYHYVESHHYKLPEKFRVAMAEGPRPPAPQYLERLSEFERSSMMPLAYNEKPETKSFPWPPP